MDSVAALKSEYRACTRCPGLQGRTQVVFGSGPSDAQVLFIGEAPGATEDTTGVPFCGMSGKILDGLLAHITLSREEIFITNTILCRPPGNRNPTSEEVQYCSTRLDKLVALMNPKVLVTIGNFATKRILGKSSIKQIRGQRFSWQGRVVVPVVHPAAYLYSGRNPQELMRMQRDFEVIAEILKECH